jgi:hypothetical protein
MHGEDGYILEDFVLTIDKFPLAKMSQVQSFPSPLITVTVTDSTINATRQDVELPGLNAGWNG